MSLRVEFLHAASEDLESAFWWYEQQQSGLGREFLEVLDGVFQTIADRPFSFPLVLRRTRKAVVRRFPHLVFFSPERDRIIVTGALHAHRDPRTWEERIREPAALYLRSSKLT